MRGENVRFDEIVLLKHTRTLQYITVFPEKTTGLSQGKTY